MSDQKRIGNLPSPLRAATRERQRERGVTGWLLSTGLDLQECVHGAHVDGQQPLTFAWWWDRLAPGLNENSAERIWLVWKATIRDTLRIPCRRVALDGGETTSFGEPVGLWFDLRAAQAKADELIEAAQVLRDRTRPPVRKAIREHADVEAAIAEAKRRMGAATSAARGTFGPSAIIRKARGA